MKKTDYIIRQIKKSYNKKYENYVVTRIWHLINNLDIKFVTQQHVTKKEGRALTDMYFPQLQLHIEVDEPPHFGSNGKQVEHDVVRQKDIINATNHFVKRINCCGDINSINQQIDEVVAFINKKIELKNFTSWDIDAEHNPQTYIDKGSISVNEDVAFLKIFEACNCFGHKYKGFQQGFTKHPHENRMIWFPKLYENKEWDNKINLLEDKIYEKRKVDHIGYFEITKNTPDRLKERLVFARVRNNLGNIMYRFKGVYKLNLKESEAYGSCVYIRVGEDVKTYKSK